MSEKSPDKTSGGGGGGVGGGGGGSVGTVPWQDKLQQWRDKNNAALETAQNTPPKHVPRDQPGAPSAGYAAYDFDPVVQAQAAIRAIDTSADSPPRRQPAVSNRYLLLLFLLLLLLLLLLPPPFFFFFLPLLLSALFYLW